MKKYNTTTPNNINYSDSVASYDTREVTMWAYSTNPEHHMGPYQDQLECIAATNY